MLDQALGPINEDQQTFLTDVAENIDRLTELINTMLDLSKIEAGRLRLERKPVDLRGLVDTTVKNYRALAGRRALVTDISHSVDAYADPDRILQVLGNFVSNAIKFTREDGTIRVIVHAQDGQVAVSICDDGAGMAAEDLPKLFKKFSQVGGGHTKCKGTGLGLSLCKELIELHQGTVSVAAELGKGSAFTFTLPCYVPRLALEEQFKERLDAVAQTSASIGVIAVHLQQAIEAKRRVTPAASEQALMEEAMDALRQHLRREDSVVAIDPAWVVMLVAADVESVRGLVERLRAPLDEWAMNGTAGRQRGAFPTGMALYPADGTTVTELLAAAVKRADSAAAPPSVPSVVIRANQN